MKQYRALEDELFGTSDEIDPASSGLDDPNPEGGYSSDYAGGMTPPDEVPVADAMRARQAPTPIARPAFSGAGADVQSKGKEWSPNFLGAIAAFTKNPALMQKLQVQEEEKKQAARELAAKPMRDLAMQQAQGNLARQQEAMRTQSESRDPKSARSAQAQKEFAEYALASADMPGLPPAFAERFRKAADMAGTMSAEQIAQARPTMDKMLGNVVKSKGADASAQLAAENMDLRREGLDVQRQNAAATRALANARFTETHQENQRRQDDREKARDEKEAEAYGKDISPLNEALATLEEAQDLKKNANTGVVSAFVNGIRKKLGVPDSNLVKLEAAQGTLNAVIRKLQAGTALSPEERQLLRETTPDVDMDDLEYELKQQRMQSTLEKKIGQVNAKHPRTSGIVQSSPVDPKVVRAREILSDPNEPPEKKAKAQRWLDAHNK